MQPQTPLFTSDSQNPPRSGHAVYLGVKAFCGNILKLQQFTFSHSIMLNICCKCVLAFDLYNIVYTKSYLPEKKKEELTNYFYFDRLSLKYK